MSLERKTWWVHTLLVAMTVWPLLHIGLVWRFDLSPWKLGGWGMYTTPRFGLIGMELYGHDPGRDEWQQLTAPTTAVREAAGTFLEHHRWLRGLARTGALAGAVASSQPEWDRLRITVSYPAIDLPSGMVVMRQDERTVALR
jgi:hypothetical protein